LNWIPIKDLEVEFPSFDSHNTGNPLSEEYLRYSLGEYKPDLFQHYVDYIFDHRFKILKSFKPVQPLANIANHTGKVLLVPVGAVHDKDIQETASKLKGLVSGATVDVLETLSRVRVGRDGEPSAYTNQPRNIAEALKLIKSDLKTDANTIVTFITANGEGGVGDVMTMPMILIGAAANTISTFLSGIVNHLRPDRYKQMKIKYKQ